MSWVSSGAGLGRRNDIDRVPMIYLCAELVVSCPHPQNWTFANGKREGSSNRKVTVASQLRPSRLVPRAPCPCDSRLVLVMAEAWWGRT
jgi:hypothetical protein